MSVRVLREPSAIVPLALSVAALATVGVHVAVVGRARQPDEGAAAHIWQLLMVTNLLAMGYFAARWLPKAGVRAGLVLLLQIFAFALAAAPVFLLEL